MVMEIFRRSAREKWRLSKILNRMTFAPRRWNYSTLPGIAKISTKPTAKDIFNQVVQGDRSALASAITLVESSHPKKRSAAEELLSKILKHLRDTSNMMPHSNASFRIGLTGPPGGGKSTLIESLGKYLTSNGHKVAVLAVDPSSARTGGSLLGDKTRMTELSRDPRAYIRPSPSSGTLGGVTRSTNEAILLCEGAGYKIILVETVGVGQSEFAVADMVDMFVLLIPPASGDELQGIKKGIVEVADLILVNKADGDLLPAAQKIQTEYISALKLLHRPGALWHPEVHRVSAITEEGIDNAWKTMESYHKIMIDSGELEQRRRNQYRIWMWNHIRDNIMDRFKRHSKVKSNIKTTEQQVMNEIITPGMGADRLMKFFSSDTEG